MSELGIALLGSLRIRQDGTPVTAFMSSKVPALLAYLAVTRRAHTRDALAALLWGNLPDADAKNNLRQSLSNLKKLFSPHLDITRDTVAFNANAPYVLDVEQFTERAARGMAPESLEAEAVLALQAAVSAYEGDFLHGFFVRDAPEFEEWALAQRTRLRELALTALHRLTEYHMACGEYRAARESAARLLEMDAWREEAHRLLMQCYARTGQRSAALAQYQKCREILRREFGVEPSAETNVLFERLRAASETPRSNLPRQASSFVGRVNDLAQIESLLLKPDCRLVTILGTGGVGKTRLALQAATHLLELGVFLDGAFFVPLAGVTAFEQIPSAMASAFGIPLAGTNDPKNQIADYLRGKEALVVVDNIEHLVDAAAWLVELLGLAPRLKLVVTSREKLNVRWEWVLPLAGIAFPRARARADAAQFDAVRLFVERAQQSAPAFELNDTTLPEVIRVCELVEGLPLGIELAAAWSAEYACDEIAREIAKSYDFLTTSLRDQSERHQSLRAVFEYSWGRLTEPERDALARLAVFSNGFTRDAAGRISQTTPRTLDALTNKALVRRSTAGRYDLHPVVKQYAQEKLGMLHGAADAAAAAHSAYYLELVGAQKESLQANAQRATITLLAAENENLRTAWLNGIERAAWAQLQDALGGITLYYDMTSQFLPARGLLNQALDTLADINAPFLRASLQAHIAYFSGRLADAAPARALAETALETFSGLAQDTRRERAFCLTTLANQANDIGDSERADEYCRAGLALRREINNIHDILGSLLTLGGIVWQRGDFGQARALMQEGLALARANNDQWNTARFSSGLGVLDNSQGDYDNALRVFPECLALYQALGDNEGAAGVMFNFGVTYYHRLEYDRALELFQASLDLRRDLGDRFGVASCITNLGEIAKAQNDFAAATRNFQAALELFREIGIKYGESYTLKGLGELAFSHDVAHAQTCFLEALRLAVETRFVPGGLELLINLARVAQHQGNLERTMQLLNAVTEHPAAFADTRRDAEQILASLPADLTAPPKSYEELVSELVQARPI